MFSKAMYKKTANTWMIVLEVHPGLSLIQSFPIHTTHFLSNWFKDCSIFKKAQGVPFLACLERCYARFFTIDLDTLLTVDCAATEY